MKKKRLRRKLPSPVTDAAFDMLDLMGADHPADRKRLVEFVPIPSMRQLLMDDLGLTAAQIDQGFAP